MFRRKAQDSKVSLIQSAWITVQSPEKHKGKGRRGVHWHVNITGNRTSEREVLKNGLPDMFTFPYKH